MAAIFSRFTKRKPPCADTCCSPWIPLISWWFEGVLKGNIWRKWLNSYEKHLKVLGVIEALKFFYFSIFVTPLIELRLFWKWILKNNILWGTNKFDFETDQMPMKNWAENKMQQNFNPGFPFSGVIL